MRKLSPEDFKDARRGRTSEINLSLDNLKVGEVMLVEPVDKTFSSDVSTYVSNAFKHTTKRFKTATKRDSQKKLEGWMVRREE